MTKKILVVEDSLLMQKMLRATLEAYRTHEMDSYFAADGHEGLVKLNEHPDTDLILLDVNMPNMSGLEFLRQVRNQPPFDDIIVVLQSTENHQEDIDRGLEAGAADYLAKPFTPTQLHDLLDQLFAGASRGEPSESQS